MIGRLFNSLGERVPYETRLVDTPIMTVLSCREYT